MSAAAAALEYHRAVAGEEQRRPRGHPGHGGSFGLKRTSVERVAIATVAVLRRCVAVC